MKQASMTTKTAMMFLALREKVEDEFRDADGRRWGQVYLDNANVCLTPRQRAGCLSQLKKLGLYKSQGDDCFGDVLMDGEFVTK